MSKKQKIEKFSWGWYAMMTGRAETIIKWLLRSQKDRKSAIPEARKWLKEVEQ